MKLDNITTALEERFALQSYRDDHFDRHVTGSGKPRPVTVKEHPGALAFKRSEIPRKALYDELADKAARQPIVKGGPIRGYIGKDGRCQKYNIETLEFTSYTVDSAGNPVTLTYFPMTAEGWERNKNNAKHGYAARLPWSPERPSEALHNRKTLSTDRPERLRLLPERL